MNKFKFISLLGKYTRKWGMPKGGWKIFNLLFPPESFSYSDEILFRYSKNLKCIASLSSYLERRWLMLGGYNPEDELFLSSLIGTNSIVFDCGANVGMYTLRFAEKAKKGKVFAFEPSSDPRHKLLRNIKINNFSDRVFPYPMGVSDKTGEAIFNIPDSNSSNKGNATLFSSFPEGNTERIILTTIDDFVEKEKIRRLDLIRLDVQGGEWLALVGAKKSIKTFRPNLSLRFNAKLAKAADTNINSLVEFAQKNSYSIFYQSGSDYLKLSSINIRNLKDGNLLLLK